MGIMEYLKKSVFLAVVLVANYVSFGTTETCNSGLVTEITAPSSGPGNLTTPNYPVSNYYNNFKCGFRLKAENETYAVKLKVIDSELVGSTDCDDDFVVAYDGPDKSHTQLLVWCGTETPIVISTGQYMFIVFFTDATLTAKGFTAEYSSGLAADIYEVFVPPTTVAPPSNAGAIAGGVVGGVVGLGLIVGGIIGIVFCVKKAKKKNGQVDTVDNRPQTQEVRPRTQVTRVMARQDSGLPLTRQESPLTHNSQAETQDNRTGTQVSRTGTQDGQPGTQFSRSGTQVSRSGTPITPGSSRPRTQDSSRPLSRFGTPIGSVNQPYSDSPPGYSSNPPSGRTSTIGSLNRAESRLRLNVGTGSPATPPPSYTEIVRSSAITIASLNSARAPPENEEKSVLKLPDPGAMGGQ